MTPDLTDLVLAVVDAAIRFDQGAPDPTGIFSVREEREIDTVEELVGPDNPDLAALFDAVDALTEHAPEAIEAVLNGRHALERAVVKTSLQLCTAMEQEVDDTLDLGPVDGALGALNEAVLALLDYRSLS